VSSLLLGALKPDVRMREAGFARLVVRGPYGNWEMEDGVSEQQGLWIYTHNRGYGYIHTSFSLSLSLSHTKHSSNTNTHTHIHIGRTRSLSRNPRGGGAEWGRERVAAVSDAGTSRPSRHQDTHIKIKRVALFFQCEKEELVLLCC